jgi:hypothetical protein
VKLSEAGTAAKATNVDVVNVHALAFMSKYRMEWRVQKDDWRASLPTTNLFEFNLFRQAGPAMRKSPKGRDATQEATCLRDPNVMRLH